MGRVDAFDYSTTAYEDGFYFCSLIYLRLRNIPGWETKSPGCRLFPTTLLLSAHVAPVAGGSGLLVGSLSGFLLLALELFRVSPEERVNHDVPLGTSLESASQVEDLTSEQPVHEGDGLLSSVVAGDCDVDVLEGRVGVAQGDARDVGVRSLLDGLGVGLGVSDDDEAGLNELAGDLVGQSTRGPSLGDGLDTSVVGELHDGSGTERSLRADNDVLGVLNGGDHSGGNHQLLPSLTEVDDVHVVGTLLVDITLHLEVQVTSADVGLKRSDRRNI